MEKKIILAIILVLVVAGAGVYGYIKFVPSEDEIYNEQMTLILNDMKVIKKDFKTSETFKSNNTTMISEKIDKLTPRIDNDLEILNDLDNSISNTTRKEYIDLCSDELKQYKSILISIKDEINLLKDVNNQEITMNEALSKMNDLDKKINKTQSKKTKIETQIKEYENKYPFILVNGTSAINPWIWTLKEYHTLIFIFFY